MDLPPIRIMSPFLKFCLYHPYIGLLYLTLYFTTTFIHHHRPPSSFPKMVVDRLVCHSLLERPPQLIETAQDRPSFKGRWPPVGHQLEGNYDRFGGPKTSPQNSPQTITWRCYTPPGTARLRWSGRNIGQHACLGPLHQISDRPRQSPPIRRGQTSETRNWVFWSYGLQSPPTSGRDGTTSGPHHLHLGNDAVGDFLL